MFLVGTERFALRGFKYDLEFRNILFALTRRLSRSNQHSLQWFLRHDTLDEDQTPFQYSMDGRMGTVLAEHLSNPGYEMVSLGWTWLNTRKCHSNLPLMVQEFVQCTLYITLLSQYLSYNGALTWGIEMKPWVMAWGLDMGHWDGALRHGALLTSKIIHAAAWRDRTLWPGIHSGLFWVKIY